MKGRITSKESRYLGYSNCAGITDRPNARFFRHHCCALNIHHCVFSRNICEWIRTNCGLDVFPFILSCMTCQTVTNFVEIQFLYFFFSVCHRFMLLNTRLGETVSTVKSREILSLNLKNVFICKQSLKF
jgi:hypothetical protein